MAKVYIGRRRVGAEFYAKGFAGPRRTLKLRLKLFFANYFDSALSQEFQLLVNIHFFSSVTGEVTNRFADHALLGYLDSFNITEAVVQAALSSRTMKNERHRDE